MFEIEPMYEKIFEDDVVIEHFKSFHSSNWKKLNVEKRKEVILKLDERIMFLQGRKAQKIIFIDYERGGNAGSYVDELESIIISICGENDTSQYDILDTYFHESRHAFQYKSVYEKKADDVNVTKKQIEHWKKNFKIYNNKTLNYIFSGQPLHFYQPVEADAFKHGLMLTQRAAIIIQNKLGEDKEFLKYLEQNASYIIMFFSDDDNSIKNTQNKLEESLALFDKNEEKNIKDEKKLKEAKESFNKGLDKISEEELYSLFNTNVWKYLDSKYQVQILQAFDKRRKGELFRDLIEIKIGGYKQNIIIDKKIYKSWEVDLILNDLISLQVVLEVDSIVNGKDKCSEQLKKELKINMHKDEKGRFVNFILEQENPFLHKIQPFVVYKNFVLSDCFKKIKKASYERFGEDDNKLDYYLDLYSIEKIKKAVQYFYDIDFSKKYKLVVKDMKKNIEINKSIQR